MFIENGSARLYREALSEAKKTEEIRKAYRVLRYVDSLGKLTSYIADSREKTLYAFAGMLAVALIPEAIGNTDVALASSIGLAAVGGAIMGDTYKPVENWRNFRGKKKIERLKNNPADVKLMASVFAKYSDVVSPSVLSDSIRLKEGRLGDKYKTDDPRLNAAEVVFKGLSCENGKDCGKKEAERREKERRTKAVVLVMDAQRQAQIERRSKCFISKEALARFTDWVLGITGLGITAYGLNKGLKSETLAGISGLGDDMLYIASTFGARPLKKFFKKFLSTEPEIKGKIIHEKPGENGHSCRDIKTIALSQNGDYNHRTQLRY